MFLCCVGSFDGCCRRRLDAVLGDCAYTTPRVLVLLVDGGLLYAWFVVGVCTSRRVFRGGARVFEFVCAGDGATYLVFIFIYMWFVEHIV